MASSMNLVDPELELSDPHPNIHEMFVLYDSMFFDGRLGSVEVKWSPRMTLCAGLCRYRGRNGQCSIHLSRPLLSLRPRKDLVETLLHEMIHAYLFVVDRNTERESHGPKFLSIMHSINKKSGTKITVYHSFHDEVAHFKTHWWQCTGVCRSQPPFYGMVKRSMNRAPGPNDTWYEDHKRKCSGSFVKIREPPKKSVKEPTKKRKVKAIDSGSYKKISDIFPPSQPNKKMKKEIPSSIPPPQSAEPSKENRITSQSDRASKFDPPKPQVNFYGIIPFSGEGNTVGGSKSGKAKGPMNNHPLLLKWEKSKKEIDEPKEVPSKSEPSTNPESTIPCSSQGQKAQDIDDSVIIVSSDDEADVASIFSTDDKNGIDTCPACGIEFKEFLQTLEEHLQGCDVLADW